MDTESGKQRDCGLDGLGPFPHHPPRPASGLWDPRGPPPREPPGLRMRLQVHRCSSSWPWVGGPLTS